MSDHIYFSKALIFTLRPYFPGAEKDQKWNLFIKLPTGKIYRLHPALKN
jgi:hypothetical protein